MSSEAAQVHNNSTIYSTILESCILPHPSTKARHHLQNSKNGEGRHHAWRGNFSFDSCGFLSNLQKQNKSNCFLPPRPVCSPASKVISKHEDGAQLKFIKPLSHSHLNGQEKSEGITSSFRQSPPAAFSAAINRLSTLGFDATSRVSFLSFAIRNSQSKPDPDAPISPCTACVI